MRQAMGVYLAITLLVIGWGCSGDEHGTSPDDTVTLEFEHSYHYAIAEYPRAVRVADIDGDGTLDFVVLSFGRDSSVVSVFEQGRNRLFGPRIDWIVPPWANDAEFADFDSDGDPDLVVAAEPSAVLWNNAHGTFSVSLLEETAWNVAVEDLDADNDADLVFGGNSFSTPVRVQLNTGNRNFGSGFQYRFLNPPTDVACADINADGETDIVTCNAEGANLVVILMQDLSEHGAGFSPRAFPAGVYPQAVISVDLDNDSDRDIVVGNLDSDNIAVYENLPGDSTLAFPKYFPAGRYPLELASADFNSDGFPDIVTCDATDILILLNDGEGNFDRSVREGLTYEIQALAVADIDSDGHTDIIVATDSEILLILYGMP